MPIQAIRVAAAAGDACTLTLMIDSLTRLIQSIDCVNGTDQPMIATVTRDSDNASASHTFAGNTSTSFDVRAFSLALPRPGTPSGLTFTIAWPATGTPHAV